MIILETNASGQHEYEIDLRVIAAMQAQGLAVDVREFEETPNTKRESR